MDGEVIARLIILGSVVVISILVWMWLLDGGSGVNDDKDAK
jgi:hypothetical protein